MTALLRIVGRRLPAAVLVLFGVTGLTFVVLGGLPGDAARQLLGPEADAAQVAQLEAQLHLDRPILSRYGSWLAGVARGDLGRSLASGQSVAGLLAARLPVTLELATFALVLALLLGVPTALLAARRPFAAFDRAAAGLCMAALSAPPYVVALLLVLVFAVRLSILPSIGFTSFAASPAGNLETLALPACSLALPLFGLYARFLRGELVEQLGREAYVSTAVAKGLGPWRVLVRHVFPNSVFGLLTIVGLQIGELVGATVVVEQIFGLPGLGPLLLTAVDTRDVMVVQAVTLVLATVVLTANLAVDVLYTLLDPRVAHERG